MTATPTRGLPGGGSGAGAGAGEGEGSGAGASAAEITQSPCVRDAARGSASSLHAGPAVEPLTDNLGSPTAGSPTVALLSHDAPSRSRLATHEHVCPHCDEGRD